MRVPSAENRHLSRRTIREPLAHTRGWSRISADHGTPPLSAETVDVARFFFAKDHLPYQSFDPKQELKKLLTRTQGDRIRRAEEIQNLKQEIVTQERGIQAAIQQLTEEALRDELELNLDEAVAIVQSAAIRFRLPISVLSGFRTSLTRFFETTAEVREITQTSPTGADLFHRCFGYAPIGEVELICKPSCVILVIENREDYLDAADELDDDPSLGVFFQTVENEPRLKNSLILVRKAEPAYGDVSELSIQNEYRMVRLQPKSSYLLEHPRIGMWGIHCTFSQGKLSEVHFSSKEPGAKIPPSLRFNGDECFLNGQKHPTHLPFFKWEETDPHTGITSSLELELDAEGCFVINDMTAEGTTVFACAPLPQTTRDPKEQETIIHELRHHLHCLFLPINTEPVKSGGPTTNSLDLFRTSKQERLAQIVDLLEKERREHVDPSVQDEIIAYYEDGTELAEIERTVIEGRSYLPAYQTRWSPVFLRTVRSRLTQEEQRRNQYFKERYGGFHIRRPEISDKNIEDAVRTSFEALIHHIPRWIQAVRRFEEEGFSRAEIITLLQQVPATQWPSLARRHLHVKRLERT